MTGPAVPPEVVVPFPEPEVTALPMIEDKVGPESMMTVRGSRSTLPSGVGTPRSEMTKLCMARYFQVAMLLTDSPDTFGSAY